jgi:hypothetical protein
MLGEAEANPVTSSFLFNWTTGSRKTIPALVQIQDWTHPVILQWTWPRSNRPTRGRKSELA